MRNKGFTLIELLAVIVILAIIALIATPIILGIINDSRESAAEESAKLVVSNFELAYSSAYMKNKGSRPDLGKVCEYFNMDNASCPKESITTDSSTGVQTATITVDADNVTCEIVSTPSGDNEPDYEIYLKCDVDGRSVATSSAVSVKKVTGQSTTQG